jgi:predicted lipoprotein with Yx(FWY)xxD motif
MRTIRFLPLAAAALLLIAGCATAGTDTGTGTGTGSDSGASDSPDVAAADLTVADSSLGQIVVDAAGMTLYFFDNDVAGSGQSSCSGQCATMWPAAHPAGTEPVADGITADVATITGTDGQPQITIDGRPVYTFANDAAPGDVNGQGVGGIWYVIGADGTELTDPQSGDISY